MRWLLLALVAVAACSDSGTSYPAGGSSGVPNGTSSGGTSGTGSSGNTPKKDGGTAGDDDDTTEPDGGPIVPSGPANVRVVAANLTSGNSQSYEAPGTRILQALKADIVLIQEFKVGDSSDPTIKQFVTTTFGDTYTYYREPIGGIPNGVISRYPMTASGHFDSGAPDRGFAWAKISVPGTHPLYAFSVHLRTSGPDTRNTEATKLVTEIKKLVPPDDYVVIGGDLNTDNRNEACVTTMSQVVDAKSPHPADENGNGNTNANRGKPYDWVLGSTNLVAHRVPTVIGASTFPNGLVFDSRVYTPLDEVAPVQENDSGVNAMQHMAVVKDFYLE